MDTHSTVIGTFVEGEVQGACNDVCCICLEEICQSDPFTVTECKHEFHLHCILEWCHRSSSCPMCWQPISLKDSKSQQLLESIEHERSLRANTSRTQSSVFHPSLGNLELHLPTEGEVDLDEHIFQHLAAAATVSNGQFVIRSEGQRNRSSPDASVPVLLSTSLIDEGFAHRVRSNVAPANRERVLSEIRFASNLSLGSRYTEEPSDLQSLSESLRTRINSWSMRYKESISRNTRGLKERLFARRNSMAELGSEVRREVNSGIASLSRLIERLDSRMNNGSRHVSQSNHAGRGTRDDR